eukprot:CAMPEP_0113969488 /NCGR_PEP_ID=MMETSP0011_2-20120614/10360_1 /TAXON_ID=101924 /ORGANISM="Rhodosorus marinus" /LENGTH=40 /DNA_ID=CAMNT_0000983181 /DNA_START=63 /DNA_END=185 /DNA_ORIENTATION=+ /assembly_acc=CAM_ASM_000156
MALGYALSTPLPPPHPISPSFLWVVVAKPVPERGGGGAGG